MQTLGDFIRERRVNTLELSLRAFCLKHGIDAGNWSKIERNMREAPKKEELAKLLEIKPDTKEWQLLEDLITTQKIKKYLSDDEVAERLPIALRATKLLSDAQLEQLKADLKET